MKKLIIVPVILLAFASFAYAQMGMKMGEGQPMQMMCPKMQQTQGQGMMHCQDMMLIITGMMDIQEKMLTGVKPEEKDKMMQDMKQTKEKILEMKGMCKCMMGGMTGQQPPASAPAPAEQLKH